MDVGLCGSSFQILAAVCGIEFDICHFNCCLLGGNERIKALYWLLGLVEGWKVKLLLFPQSNMEGTNGRKRQHAVISTYRLNWPFVKGCSQIMSAGKGGGG